MKEGYHTIVSKQERSALLGPLRDHVMATFAGEGTTWTGKALSNRNGSTAGDAGAAPTYDAKEVKVALKVSNCLPRCLRGPLPRALSPPPLQHRCIPLHLTAAL